MGLATAALRQMSYANQHNAQQNADAAQARQAEQSAAALLAAERAAEAREAGNLADRLDEASDFVSRYVACTPAQADAMTLIAAATWVTDPKTLATTSRVLFTSTEPKSGKTEAMTLTASLSCNAQDTSGTDWAVNAGFAEAAGQGQQAPTMYFDDVSKEFGESGTRGQGKPLYKILCKGYKRNATLARSVDRTRVEYSIFSTFLMTGLHTAVPYDVWDRCIIFRMIPGVPERYFDVRDAGSKAEELAAALGLSVRGNRESIRRFRVRWLRKRELLGRRGEVWESVFAVAYCAGQVWVDRAWAAFCELAGEGEGQIVLSPKQSVIKVAAGAAASIMDRDRDVPEDERDHYDHHGRDFIPGAVLRDEMRHIDPDRFAEESDTDMGYTLRDNLPCAVQRVRVGDRVVRGHYYDELRDAWDAIRPAPPATVEVIPDDDPYADEWDDTDCAA